MWFGKDADGNVTQFLAKDKNARVLSLRQDSSFSLRDTSKLYKGDSAFIGGLKATRLYFGALTSDSIRSTAISARRLTLDSLLKLPLRNDACTSDGSIWYNEEHGSIHSCIDGMIASHSRVLFVQQNTVLDSNSVTETDLIGSDPVHPLDSFPVGYFLLGKTHRFHLSGVYSTKVTGPGNMIVRIKTNATVLCSVVVALDANELDQEWGIDGFNVCVDTGTSGEFRVNTGFHHTIAGVMHSDNIQTPNGGTTQSTKVKIKPTITFQFSLADVRNKIKSTQCIIEELH
jgi:hypothetical protein